MEKNMGHMFHLFLNLKNAKSPNTDEIGPRCKGLGCHILQNTEPFFVQCAGLNGIPLETISLHLSV